MINAAIMGYGTIGSGVYEVIRANADILKKNTGRDVAVKYVLDLREFPGSPVEGILVHNLDTILKDPDVVGECVVVDLGNGEYEIKNIATAEAVHGKGYGRALIDFVKEHYRGRCRLLLVGTGDSPLTVPFYEKCGFTEHHRVKNFFTDNYDHPIYEAGVQLVDMVYLAQEL